MTVITRIMMMSAILTIEDGRSVSGQMEKLEWALSRQGFSESEIEKIFFGNVLRVMKDAMK